MADYTEHHIKTPLQLVYLVLTIVGCTILGLLLAMLIIAGIYGADMILQVGTASVTSPPDVINALKIYIVVGNTLAMFLAPALFFGYLIMHNPGDYLKTTGNFNRLLIPLILVIMFASGPVMELMININQKMVLPGFLKGIEQWMREQEDATQHIIQAITKMDNTAGLLSTIFVVALMPAIAEEFLFRGCLQTIFQRWTGSAHAAVWITAIIFSAVHLEFFGFLPRMLLGALLGYMVVWSGSIWTSVWAHFINNGTAVVGVYLYQHKQIQTNPDSNHIFNYPLYIISLIIVLFLLWVYRYTAVSKKQLPDY